MDRLPDWLVELGFFLIAFVFGLVFLASCWFGWLGGGD